MTKISREALNRKIASVVQSIEDKKTSDRNIKEEREKLMKLRDHLDRSIEEFSANDTLNKLESRGKLIQSLHSAHEDANYQLDVLSAPPKQSFDQVSSAAIKEFLSATEAYRKSGGEYFDGSVQYLPSSGKEVEALQRVVTKLENKGYPVKVLNQAERKPKEEIDFNIGGALRLYEPFEFVTSLQGVDAFEELARSEELQAQGNKVTCKRMMLDFSGDLWKSDDVSFDPEKDSHGGHVSNGYEKRAFLMAKGPEWGPGYVDTPKAEKFLKMALCGSAQSNENQIFYMFRSNQSGSAITPASLAQTVQTKMKGNEYSSPEI